MPLIATNQLKRTIKTKVYAYLQRNKNKSFFNIKSFFHSSELTKSKDEIVSEFIKIVLNKKEITVVEIWEEVMRMSLSLVQAEEMASTKSYFKHGSGRSLKLITDLSTLIAPLAQKSCAIPSTQMKKIEQVIAKAKPSSAAAKLSENSKADRKALKALQTAIAATQGFDATPMTYATLLALLKSAYNQIQNVTNTKTTGIKTIESILHYVVPAIRYSTIYKNQTFLNLTYSGKQVEPFSWAWQSFEVTIEEILKNQRLKKILFLVYMGKAATTEVFPNNNGVFYYQGTRIRIKDYNKKEKTAVYEFKNKLYINQGLKVKNPVKLPKRPQSLSAKNGMNENLLMGMDIETINLIIILDAMNPKGALTKMNDIRKGIIKVQKAVGDATIEKLVFRFFHRIYSEHLVGDLIKEAFALLDRFDPSCFVTIDTFLEEYKKLTISNVKMFVESTAAIPLSKEDRAKIFKHKPYKPEQSSGITGNSKRVFTLIMSIVGIGLEEYLLKEEQTVQSTMTDTLRTNALWGAKKVLSWFYGDYSQSGKPTPLPTPKKQQKNLTHVPGLDEIDTIIRLTNIL